MATKTFKIGEYAKGGVITAEATKDKVTIIQKEWDYSKGSSKGSDQSNAKELSRLTVSTDKNGSERTIDNYLCDLTSSYYAGQILDWVKTKTKFTSTEW